MTRIRLPLIDRLQRWPVIRQVAAGDATGLGDTARSERTSALRPRIDGADRVVGSVCPYCGVGCGQLVYLKNDRITDIEGDPDSPISEGCLCPKGAATMQLVTGEHRERRVLYRRPGGTAWETLALDTAMDMVADRVQRTRDRTWQERLDGGQRVQRTMAIVEAGRASAADPRATFQSQRRAARAR